MTDGSIRGGMTPKSEPGGSEYSGMLSGKSHKHISEHEYIKSFNYNLPTMKQGRYAFNAYLLTN